MKCFPFISSTGIESRDIPCVLYLNLYLYYEIPCRETGLAALLALFKMEIEEWNMQGSFVWRMYWILLDEFFSIGIIHKYSAGIGLIFQIELY